MSGDTLYERPRRHHVAKMRVHDYLYDSVFIVSSARDYARTAFKAAMESAQLCIQPVYSTMFSELRKFPRMQVVYHPNCRLPDHMDRSYGAYLEKVQYIKSRPTPTVGGTERYKFSAVPKKVLCMPSVSPQFRPPTPVFVPGLSNKPRNRGTQSVFRESSAQTTPWQPDGKQADGCEKKPEVLYLDALEWGPGRPYRIGDLPADFHTTEIINKMRHARTWHDVVEKGQFPRWMKKRDEIICDVETKDWIFREAEIDELQDIRLELLHRLQSQQRQNQTSRISKKLAKLWAVKKQEMEKKIYHIRHKRDRELRKLSAVHSGGGRQGQVARMRAARGSGSMTHTATDPTSDLFAPLARHGYQARKRHAEIIYDPTLLSLEDHAAIAEPPAWLEQCGQDLKHTCSGHHLKRDPTQLCERETKWSEIFLENLHNDLKKARLGAASASPGPLHILKPRLQPTPRPSTPEVEAVDDAEEASHQSALLLQKVLRGRAVQCLMYEGRTRAAELTEELKTTHGLQKEDKIRITKEETKAREYNVLKTEAERKEDAITALVDELCGGAVAAALDFLEKELRRLKEERRQHAFILIAIREKTMREAAEAGRRQKEEHRRREHDEMFKKVLGVTQETVDAYLLEILKEGVELAAEEEAVKRAQAEAEKIDLTIKENKLVSTAEENELVAELVHQFLLPNAHKTAARYRINALQQAKMDAARKTIFGLFDEAEIKQGFCNTCGCPLGEMCRCRSCRVDQQPIPTTSRDDPRWKHARRRPRAPEKTLEERYPPAHDFRCMLNTLIYEVVEKSRQKRAEGSAIGYDVKQRVKEKTELALDAREFVQTVLDRATGAVSPPVKLSNYRHTMKRIIVDALQRSEPYPTSPCQRELPSEIRQRAEEEAARKDPTCRCIEQEVDSKTNTLNLTVGSGPEDRKTLLPSELRILDELKRCKCDKDPHPTPDVEDEMSQYFEDTSGEETVITDED